MSVSSKIVQNQRMTISQWPPPIDFQSNSTVASHSKERISYLHAATVGSFHYGYVASKSWET